MAQQIENKIIITGMSEGIVLKGVKRKLLDAGLDATYSRPLANFLKEYEETAAVFVIYLSDDVSAMNEAIVYINDLVKAHETDLVIIGDLGERTEVLQSVPDVRITEWVERPLDMDAFVKLIKKLIKIRESRASGKSILIVDDDPTYARMVREWLKDDYQVFVVTSGMQAISFLMKRKVDLVLLDYEMPVTTGTQVLRMLRSEPETKDIHIVFLTGVGDESSVKEVIALKPEGYILKSTTKSDLMKWIKVFFANKA
ncbi:MAG: response regulator [Lachnospiraceae bacterium]|nr:response regulator [Lachnospiraceae bacterium]